MQHEDENDENKAFVCENDENEAFVCENGETEAFACMHDASQSPLDKRSLICVRISAADC